MDIRKTLLRKLLSIAISLTAATITLLIAFWVCEMIGFIPKASFAKVLSYAMTCAVLLNLVLID